MKDGQTVYSVHRGDHYIEYTIACWHGRTFLRVDDAGTAKGVDPEDAVQLRSLGSLHRGIWLCGCDYPTMETP